MGLARQDAVARARCGQLDLRSETSWHGCRQARDGANGQPDGRQLMPVGGQAAKREHVFAVARDSGGLDRGHAEIIGRDRYRMAGWLVGNTATQAQSQDASTNTRRYRPHGSPLSGWIALTTIFRFWRPEIQVDIWRIVSTA